MTRWARSGNTQKHKKQPGDATPWSEFANKGVDKSSSFKQRKGYKQKKEEHSEKSTSQHSGGGMSKKIKFEHDSNKDIKSSPKEFKASTSFDLKDKKKKKKKKNHVKLNVEESLSTSIANADERNDSANISDGNKTPSPKKKKTFLEKLKNKRAEKGIVLLPSQVERRLYNIKRRLREKGFPPAVLKDIMRKERRKEELKFRKTFNTSKPCFNCRKPGHMVADCPEKLGSTNQETGICFKCGSSEHTSFKCPKKVQGFPYAKCFICKEQGHISRDCPTNKHGVYPKGGRCYLCGNVNHLKADCPSLIKKEKEESEVTLTTINEATSIDDEVMEKKKTNPKRTVKKPKIVKF